MLWQRGLGGNKIHIQIILGENKMSSIYYKSREQIKNNGGNILIFTKSGANFRYWTRLIFGGAIGIPTIAFVLGIYYYFSKEEQMMLSAFIYGLSGIAWLIGLIVMRFIFAPRWNEALR